MSEKKQPAVSVGIMGDKRIEFTLCTDYKCSNGSIVSGNAVVELVDGEILYNGKKYESLLFEACVPEGSFWLRGVTIGVNFHWERKEDQRFGNNLKFIVEGDRITAINLIGVEDYLTSVISSEMSATASEELLKAHAVISRSWLLAQMAKNKEITTSKSTYSAFTENEQERIKWYDREDHINFDVCADDHCQRYQGMTRQSTTKVREAIEATWGELLKYDGKICDARFSKSCGGAFEEFQNCWENVRYPYLAKQRDSKRITELPDLTQEEEAFKWITGSPEAFCNTTDKEILSQVLNNYDQETTDFYRWRVEYTPEELSALILKRIGIDFGLVTDLIPVERGTSGRLIKLKIVGSKRTLTIGKELEIRKALSPSHLYSSAFVVLKENGKFVLVGAGWGHGVGLCQIGAAVMGAQGYKYKDILLHYYIGASIEKEY
ncbi:MAG: SpoIID/LytB domain-containing protein [bacterium]|nr:SpoIID/LytB domain-containing protein [bacterium]MDD7235881.1 SpoIID/LytB domain-containing protein [bacterium]MDY2650753.1 SpoIID/LytB domain-containing protein [Candidatus Egerieousia sp.]MDY3134243.1 SpoIID/LytB domain-containing protein [Candidatus Egerieousia sp.]